MAGNIREAHKEIWRSVQRFFGDVRRLFSASKRTVILLIVVETILGLSVAILLLLLAQTMDAVIGARAVRIVTSDVSNTVTRWIGFGVLLFPTVVLHHQWTGLAERIGSRIRTVFFLTSTGMLALPIAPFLLPVIAVSAWLVTYARSRFIHLIFSAVVVAYAGWSLHRLVVLAIYQTITVGDVFLIGGSLAAFVGFLAIRPYVFQEV